MDLNLASFGTAHLALELVEWKVVRGLTSSPFCFHGSARTVLTCARSMTGRSLPDSTTVSVCSATALARGLSASAALLTMDDSSAAVTSLIEGMLFAASKTWVPRRSISLANGSMPAARGWCLSSVFQIRGSVSAVQATLHCNCCQAIVLLTQNDVRASVVNEQHRLPVLMLAQQLNNLVKMVDHPGPRHERLSCLHKGGLHRQLTLKAHSTESPRFNLTPLAHPCRLEELD